MATSACPNCRAYVEVPNVEGSQPFTCPYCRKPNLLLYKCYSCMKASILQPSVSRACPRCNTLLRAADINRALAPPPPLNEADVLYHVTSPLVARIVRLTGLRSALLRTGHRNPDPGGSFVRDFRARRTGLVQARIRQYGVVMRENGVKLEAVMQKSIDLPPYAAAPTGSNDDYAPLTTWENNTLAAYARALGVRAFKRMPKNLSKLVKESGAEPWAMALDSMPQHVLTLLAGAAVDLNFGVEAAITASHVYFLNTTDQKVILDGFQDYTKLRNLHETVILRVRRNAVVGLHQDEADYRALRTTRAVNAKHFEILVNPGWPQGFLNQVFRVNPANWQSLESWLG